MIKIDTSKLVKKLEKLKVNLNKNVSNTMEELVREMQANIVNLTAMSYIGSWARANKNDGSGKYFTDPGNRYIQMLASPLMIRHKKDKEGFIQWSFGNAGALDRMSLTKQKGTSVEWWRLFEEGTGSRVGGSDKSFIPAGGYGDRGAGFSVDDNDDEEGGHNPGFRPVHMFAETAQHYKKIIKRKVDQAIKKSIKESGF